METVEASMEICVEIHHKNQTCGRETAKLVLRIILLILTSFYVGSLHII